MNYFDVSNLNTYFEKKFCFVKEKEWNLPLPDSILKDDIWEIGMFQDMKRELNETKSVLNDKGEHWQEHTSQINKAGLVIESVKRKIQTDLLTQAWCKFYEILSSYSVVPDEAETFTSLHLCEAPGAFISALNSYLNANHPNISWIWYGNTLNPYYEGHSIKNVIVDDRLLFPTLRHWYFGSDNTGDITNPSYLKDLKFFLDNDGLLNLVTADGSFNCVDNPAEQETIVAELHFSEMLIALHYLAPAGTFVVKKFTFFECATICKMYLLNCVFEEVHVFKPFTSKSGNSEVYVICLGYLGTEHLNKYLEPLTQAYASKRNKALFPLSSIPQSFLSQLLQCSRNFLELQKESIIENIKLYSTPLCNYEDQLFEVQKKCAHKFIEKYNIFSEDIQENKGNIRQLFRKKKQITPSFYCKDYRKSKSLYFQALFETFENLTKSQSMAWKDVVSDVEKRLNMCFPMSEKRSHEGLEWCFVWKEIMNRMKSKSYKNWITIGEKVHRIQNSKFCNPLLLYLWNRISYDSKVQMKNHESKTHCYWDINALLPFLIEDRVAEDFCIIFLSIKTDKESKNDPLFSHLKKTFNNSFECFSLNTENIELNFAEKTKLIYVNTTYWVDSLHQELMIKHNLINIFKHFLKILSEGDTVIICMQNPLTRYAVGILFMLLSLFEKFVCVLPMDIAPAGSGQLWILRNYRKKGFIHQITDHLETIQKLEVPKRQEILEVVPISALCGGHFYEFLLDVNNRHLLQRLRSLTAVEKIQLQKSV